MMELIFPVNYAANAEWLDSIYTERLFVSPGRVTRLAKKLASILVLNLMEK